eukprot:symbB.v1.2.004977.t3/scaffold288.1/size478366/7
MAGSPTHVGMPMCQDPWVDPMWQIGFTPFGCLFQRGEKNKHQSDSLFKVVLQCEVGEQFGMVLGGNADMDGLVIVDIADASAASRWNASRPMDFLEIGQAVAAVNGKSDWQGMLEEFRRMNTVELVINRKRNSIQTAIFQASLKLHRRSLALNPLLEEVEPLQLVESCSICHDDMDGQHQEVRLPCGHRFHQKCVKRWFLTGSRSLRCPLCNYELEADVPQEDIGSGADSNTTRIWH